MNEINPAAIMKSTGIQELSKIKEIQQNFYLKVWFNLRIIITVNMLVGISI